MSDGLLLAISVGLAAVGGELFVRGAVGFAAGMRVPPGIVGATVAAFATSTPEFSVAMNAAFTDQPAIALGDALGSNIVNIAVVLGLVLAFAPLRPERPDIRRDLPVAFAAPLLTVALVADGTFGRIDAVVALLFFVTWLAITVLQARRARIATAEVLGERKLRLAGIEMALGLGVLVVAGRLIVVA
ncbi:MAG: sodium:calcium antiporter, partial [Dehalococcoidia bacterium]